MAIKRLLLAKKEDTYDQDNTPDATNPIETMDLETQRYEGDRVQRDVDRQILGGKDQININPHVNMSFGVPYAAAGAAGTEPAWGVLLQACGFTATDNSPTDWTYQLPTDQATLIASDSVVCYDYRAQINLRQIITGVRGACSINMARGGLPRFDFSNMMGTYNRPTNQSEISIGDWSAWKNELTFTKDNVPTLTLDSESACTDSFSINFGQQVARRNLPGCQQTVITGYEITGNMTIVAPTVATKDWYAEAETHAGVSSSAFALTMGSTAGSILELAASDVAITNIQEGESQEGDLTYTFDLTFKDSPTLVVK